MRTSKKVYVASSWRNAYQPQVVDDLRKAGHDVYDFRNPNPEDPDNNGFGWQLIDPNWKSWTAQQFKEILKHPIAVMGHRFDQDALNWCNVCVLVLPSGSSAHLEAGWCAGQGKATVVYAPEIREPELMYKTFEEVPAAIGLPTLYNDFHEVLEFVDKCDIALTPDEISSLSVCDTGEKWNAACLLIKKARGGKFPFDWWPKIIESGFMSYVRAKFQGM